MRVLAGLTALVLLCCGCARAVQQAAPEPPTLHVASATDQGGPWTNALVTASSPYLLLHAHNPVDWHPWGEEAFDEARRRNVPVFLSIGYASCHWCRVMEAESFTDPAVAAFLNERFVPVKVDREERPDVDALYSQALRELIGRNGWPASLFVTPEGEPFSGGTYFPDKPRKGKPSFRQAMETALVAWEGDRDALLARSARLSRELQDQAQRARGAEIPPQSAVAAAVTDLATSHDHVHGGWGSKKFPRAPILELLLDRAALGDEDAKEPLVHALDGMALGGIYDHLGGGFHRYTLDRAWRVPHFEKMLYDNAQLAAVYLDAWRVLRADRYREVGQRTLAWMVAELWSDEAGAFMSSLSADSDGEEGAFYTWTRRDLVRVLGPADGERAAALFRVSDNKPTALSLHDPLPADAGPLVDALFAARAQRARPDLDDKVVVAWNGLALTALARGLLVQDDPGMRRVARRLAETLLAARRDDGTLPRTLGPDAATGVLDDHAFVAEGLLDLYEVDPDPRWLAAAGELGRVLQERFAAESGGYWYTVGTGTSPTDPTLLARQLDWRDGDEPSGLGRATLVTQRLAALGAPGVDGDQVDRTLKRGGRYLARGGGSSFSSLVRALASTWRGSFELIVVGRPDADDTRALMAVYAATRRPGMVLGVAPPDGLPKGWSAFAGKVGGLDGARATLCRQGACEMPTDDPTVLAVQVARALGVSSVAP